MNRYSLLLLSAALAGCANQPVQTVQPQVPEVVVPSSSSTAQTSAVAKNTLEQVPAELSIAHFSQMQLEGKNLEYKLVSQNESYARYNITYQSNGLTVSGIMNLPNGDGPFPLVLLNHGFIDPAVYTQGRGLKREQDYLARQGFAVLHSDYRGHAASDPSPDTREVYDAGLEYSMDVLNAVQAVKNSDLSQIDTEKIGMLGHSMGGGVTLNIIAAYPNLVDAAILYAPVHADAWENFTRWRDMRDEGDKTRTELGTQEENPATWDALSSLTYLKNTKTPVLLFQGTNDADVPKEWSDFLADYMQSIQKPITYIVYPGEKHEFIAQWNNFMQRTTNFLRAAFGETAANWLAPIQNATSRITKKPFGIYITPENSPVSPEKFRGYHSGTDFELLEDEIVSNVKITAACTGKVLYKNTVNGYGGVLVQSCFLDNEPVTVLYGHLSLASIPYKTGDEVQAGTLLGTLGEGYSQETDGERPHLHFSIHKGPALELAGYAANEEKLQEWIDPLVILQ